MSSNFSQGQPLGPPPNFQQQPAPQPAPMQPQPQPAVQPQQPYYQQGWDGAQGHPSTIGHNDYPSPGDIHLTHKQYFTRLAVALLTGIVVGGIIMFRLFPIFVRVLQATATGS